MNGATDEDCRIIRRVCGAVSTRAARLAAAGVVALVRKVLISDFNEYNVYILSTIFFVIYFSNCMIVHVLYSVNVLLGGFSVLKISYFLPLLWFIMLGT